MYGLIFFIKIYSIKGIIITLIIYIKSIYVKLDFKNKVNILIKLFINSNIISLGLILTIFQVE